MSKRPKKNEPAEEVLIYCTEDGQVRMDVRSDGDTVWLSQEQMARLFDKDKSSISRHVRNVIAEGEFEAVSVVALFATTAADGKTYQVEHYNLDMIISVGYRVNSHVGVHFGRWATERLREFIIKGFVLDDARLKQARDGYFDDLLLSKLPESLDAAQKKMKVGNLLSELRMKGLIKNTGTRNKPRWVLSHS